MIVKTSFSIVIAILSSTFTETRALSQTELAENYAKFDLPIDHASFTDCIEGDAELHNQLCPNNLKLACGPIEGIREFCEKQIGEELTAEANSQPKHEHKNAIEGCMKYVGYYVFDEEHMACCESDTCEDWLEEQFNLKYGAEDDADYYDDDDFENEVEDEEF
mmetsp:Transcript_3141/g.4421  ORF Transcript_3141/g.4421 Transcript_3141/m.4421 type:complete len:163 (+) Transcript_3141:87-575(+)